MGAFLDKPKTEKHTEKGTGNGLKYGVSSMQGWRVEMEDAHCATIGLPLSQLNDWSFFAVFDGHAGAKVSEYCAKRLLEVIVESNEFKSEINDQSTLTPETVINGIKSGFLKLDDEIRENNGEDKSGSTAVCSLISPKHVFVANCGDSRMVLSRAGKCVFNTLDHKPINPQERERIQNAGGSVMIQRVNGSLAVSRALGDFDYKNVEGKGQCEQLVSPEPEISSLDRTDEDEFLILACDGIWDVMSNDELCDFVRSRMRITDDLEAICSCVVDTCLSKGSRDNMSIVIVAFAGWPCLSQQALDREAELDELLERKIQGARDFDFKDVLEDNFDDDVDNNEDGDGDGAINIKF
ncbi:hypothetical protein HELRODRAFT_107894 [Helobdella robusta]|uniref:PPM-type phosphatase domain-containing protein n=1 Tax=Helobdella robusta TaxID=6412 RepID=T1EED7_HELRO|nr:hypothetical protein HELRODRAFT_107894 [Helobdella robusta]ESN94661.1 hypothetical protein HELRODRAFT_107894 [Helobdella robusta]